MENVTKDEKKYFKSEEVTATGHKEEESQPSDSPEIRPNSTGVNAGKIVEAVKINSSVQADVLKKIVGVLGYLLRCRQETVSISKLVGNYAELHGEELSPKALGFHSTEDLMFYLTHQKKWITPVGVEDKYLIATIVLEEVGETNILIALQSEERRVTMDAVTLDEVAELNRIGASLQVGQSFLANIDQVDSIEDLWICNQEDVSERNKLMKELREFYKLPDNKKRYKVFEKSHCQIGRWMAAKYKDQGMHRVVVKRVLSKHQIKVQYFDYGTSETISLKNLYFLSKKFLAWPIMAAHVSIKDDIRASNDLGFVTGRFVGNQVSTGKETGGSRETVGYLL